MKKFLVLICAILLLSSNAVFAISASDKTQFYDGFVTGFFWSLNDSIIKSGVPKEKATKYVAAMKARLNRSQLEAQTWACVSKYNTADLFVKQNAISKECFSTWADNYIHKNIDLLNLLK